MAEEILPATLVAGDGWSFDSGGAWGDTPGPTWSLDLIFRPEAGGAVVIIAGTWTGAAWTFTAAPATTAAFAAGLWSWSAVATDAALPDRRTLGAGRITVKPDPTTFTGDGRSDAARILAAIDATLEGRITRDAESYTIEGRSLSRTPVADLLRLRNLYARIVAQEDGRAPGGIMYRRARL